MDDKEGDKNDYTMIIWQEEMSGSVGADQKERSMLNWQSIREKTPEHMSSNSKFNERFPSLFER